MIQITRYMDPDELIWFEGEYIATLKWAEIEAQRIEESTGKETMSSITANIFSIPFFINSLIWGETYKKLYVASQQ